MKLRDHHNVAARMRSSAGPMRDRRAPRGGARNRSRDLLEEAREDAVGDANGRAPGRPDHPRVDPR